MALYGVLLLVGGRIEDNGGRGWDGENYVKLLEGDTRAVPQNAYLRGGIILLNRPLYVLTGDWRLTVTVMNAVYAGLVALFAAALFGIYQQSVAAKAVMVASLALSIATAKVFAYYPSLIDLGAYAVLLAAVYAVLRWPPAAAASLCALAVVSREFGIFVCLFGVVRYARERRSLWRGVLTFAPPLALWVVLRIAVGRFVTDVPMLSAATLLGNLRYWQDPVFVAFHAYFLVTLAGGVTLAVAARPGAWLRAVRREPEWAVLILLPLAAAAVGSLDIWRYQAYVLPAVPALFAAAFGAVPSHRRRWFLLAVLAATLVTQRPWQHIDEFAYFRDWFPYYAVVGSVPNEGTLPVWPVWGWRMAATAALCAALAAIAIDRRRQTGESEPSGFLPRADAGTI